jgi:serine/threonine protein phosphatase PrpC
MPFVAIEMRTLHTVAGIVSLASLGVALLEVARLRWFARRRPWPVIENTVASEHARSSPASALTESVPDDEPTIAVAIPHFEEMNAVPQPPPRVSTEPVPKEAETPHILLVCEDGVEPDEATSPHARILVTASGATDRGKKRRINEDCFLLLHDHAVFAVADGMGGYNGGEVASSVAVNTIREAFEAKAFGNELRSNVPLPRRSRELASALLEANRNVSELARQNPELSQMGTTLVAARFSPNKQRVYVANVGDSRCYRLRSGKLTQLTTDHTMGRLGDRGPTQNQLYRAIGVKPIVDIDVVVDVPQAEDVYLLCSDGLPKMAGDEEIQDLLSNEADLELAAHRLIDMANEAGGRDNVTVVLVRVQDRVGRVDGPVELARKEGLAQLNSRQDHAGRRASNGTE